MKAVEKSFNKIENSNIALSYLIFLLNMIFLEKNKLVDKFFRLKKVNESTFKKYETKLKFEEKLIVYKMVYNNTKK